MPPSVFDMHFNDIFAKTPIVLNHFLIYLGCSLYLAAAITLLEFLNPLMIFRIQNCDGLSHGFINLRVSSCWRISASKRWLGSLHPSRVRVTGGKVICKGIPKGSMRLLVRKSKKKFTGPGTGLLQSSLQSQSYYFFPSIQKKFFMNPSCKERLCSLSLRALCPSA